MISLQGKFGNVNTNRTGMNWARVISAFLVFVLFSCDKEPEEATRSFRMGFTTVPRKWSSKATEYTYQQLAQTSDITNHQFDHGVPWQEALTGSNFAHHIIQDWSYRKSLTPTTHKVLVSASPLRAGGNGIAKYLGIQEDMSLPAPWNKYSFRDEPVRTAYLNYCRRLINYFNPDYFNMSVEANVLYLADPKQWKDFISFHKFVYTGLKTEFPSLVIFSSVAATQMIPDHNGVRDHVKEKLAVLQLMENSDLYALTFKPGMVEATVKNYSDNSFSSLFNVSVKPLAIAETGFEFSGQFNNHNATSPQSQAVETPKFMSALLKESEVHKATFVINFALQSHEDILKTHSITDQKELLRKVILNDQTGLEKPPVAVWHDYQKRTYKP